MSNWLLQYRSAIRSGEILAGMDMIRELDNLLDDLDDPQYRYDTRDAEIRISFIESCIKLTKAPYYGKPMKLMLWQKAFIEVIYSFKIRSLDTGRWVNRFQEILLLIPRKNGKTELVAALMLTDLILGEPGSDIVCSGMDDGTASLAYKAIDTMRLLIDPKSVDTWRNQQGIQCFANHSNIYKMSEKTQQREGRNIDIAGLDEAWSLAAASDIYNSIKQSTSSKEVYRIYIFGSEGFVNDGFLDRKRTEYTQIIEGEDDSEAAKRQLPWLYTQDTEQEIWQTDENGISRAWQKSNPAIGVIKKWGNLRDFVDKARKDKTTRVYVLCKDFNIKKASAVAWLDPDDYRYHARFEIETFGGTVCLGAVDLSETTDMTSAKVLMLRKDDPVKYIFQHYWIPEGKLQNADDKKAGAQYVEWARQGMLTICEGSDIDLTLVADWFYQLYKDFGIMLYKCGYDVKFSKEFLRRMEEYGFDCELVLQTKQTLSNAVKLCENDLKSQRVNYNENEIDFWCLGNAALEVDNNGNCQIVKVEGQPGMRIDGAVTFSIVYEMYRRYRSELVKLVK